MTLVPSDARVVSVVVHIVAKCSVLLNCPS